LEWQSTGLNPPAKARVATDEYFAEENLLAAWLDERCERGPYFAATAGLFADWQEWMTQQNQFIGTMKTFAQDLQKVPGISRDRNEHARGFHGLQLRNTYRLPDWRNRGVDHD
jgi:putative DNA primase/helicase